MTARVFGARGFAMLAAMLAWSGCYAQEAGVTPEAVQAPKASASAAPAPANPRDVRLVPMAPAAAAGFPQGPLQGELYTARDQIQGVPVLVMPIAPDRLAGLAPGAAAPQLLVMPLVNESSAPGAATAESEVSATQVPSAAAAIEGLPDPFQPPAPIAATYPVIR